MGNRNYLTIDFTYDDTDPAIVRNTIAQICADEPRATAFQISDWHPYFRDVQDPRGFFTISYSIGLPVAC